MQTDGQAHPPWCFDSCKPWCQTWKTTRRATILDSKEFNHPPPPRASGWRWRARMPTLGCFEAVLQWSCGQHLVYVFLFRVCSRARASDSKREERPPYGQTSEHRFSRIVVQIRGRTVSDDPFSLSYATVHRQKKLLGIDFGWRWRACMPALLWSDAVLQWSWSTSGPSVPKVCGFACAHALQIVNMKKDPVWANKQTPF